MTDQTPGLFQRLKNFFCSSNKTDKEEMAFKPDMKACEPTVKTSQREIEIPESEKKDVTTLLTEEKFWNLIGESQSADDLYEKLSPLSEDELFGFRYWWEHFCNISYRQDLWAAAYIYRGGCGDDSFDYFRYWLITQGRKVFYNALENADSLCDVFAELPDEDPTDEEANYVVIDLLNRRNNDSDYYHRAVNRYRWRQEERPEMEFEWEEDDEESLRKVCPNTFDRWWGKLR